MKVRRGWKVNLLADIQFCIVDGEVSKCVMASQNDTDGMTRAAKDFCLRHPFFFGTGRNENRRSQTTIKETQAREGFEP
jgi:hypothetical protein